MHMRMRMDVRMRTAMEMVGRPTRVTPANIGTGVRPVNGELAYDTVVSCPGSQLLAYC